MTTFFAEVPLFPEQASETAERVDALFFFLMAVTGAAGLLVSVLVIGFAVRYRRRGEDDRTPRILGSRRLEWFWTITPTPIFLIMFAWGASIYSSVTQPPPDATEVFVVGKQWMWKIQHPGGQRETNELHVPVGRATKLTLTSEDVVHDFGMPAFRTKIDVIPGRYVSTWIKPTKPGRYHLFCNQYCGTSHAEMVGSIVVMDGAEFDDWLGHFPDGSLATQGRQLFLKLQCITCHSADSQARAPVLEDLYVKRVPLRDGGTVIADEGYLRESILYPRAKIVQGWEPIMPTFKGQVDEEELIRLIAFIKALRQGMTPKRNEEFPPPVGAPTTPAERDKSLQRSLPGSAGDKSR
jgi:cytochrome c oxidase subunit 2